MLFAALFSLYIMLLLLTSLYIRFACGTICYSPACNNFSSGKFFIISDSLLVIYNIHQPPSAMNPTLAIAIFHLIFLIILLQFYFLIIRVYQRMNMWINQLILLFFPLKNSTVARHRTIKFSKKNQLWKLN